MFAPIYFEDSCAALLGALGPHPLASTHVRRSVPKPPHRPHGRSTILRLQGGFARFGGPPVLADPHQSTTAIKHDALGPQLARKCEFATKPLSCRSRQKPGFS